MYSSYAWPEEQTTRIVSLVPGLTETCFAIGAGEQIVGVSDFCNYPPEAKNRQRVGGLGNPRLEQVLLLRPSVVLVYRSQADFAEKMRALNVNCRLYALDRISDVYTASLELGHITGHHGQAEQLVHKMKNELEAIQRRGDETTRLRAMVIVSRDPAELRNLYQAGPQNFLGEILRIAGGMHALPGGASVSKEKLLLSDPQVIIDLSGAEARPSPAIREAAAQTWNQLSTLSAVRTGRVHYLVDPHALVPGPNLPRVAKQFQELLSPVP